MGIAEFGRKGAETAADERWAKVGELQRVAVACWGKSIEFAKQN